MKLERPFRASIGSLDRIDTIFDGRTKPVALVRAQCLRVGPKPGRLKRVFRRRDVVRRDEQIDVRHWPSARLIEIRACGVKSLEDDGRDVSRQERIDRRQHLPFDARRTASAVDEMFGENAAGPGPAVTTPSSIHRPIAGPMPVVCPATPRA